MTGMIIILAQQVSLNSAGWRSSNASMTGRIAYFFTILPVGFVQKQPLFLELTSRSTVASERSHWYLNIADYMAVVLV